MFITFSLPRVVIRSTIDSNVNAGRMATQHVSEYLSTFEIYLKKKMIKLVRSIVYLLVIFLVRIDTMFR